MPDFTALNTIAASQLTCFTRDQARSAGIDYRMLARKVANDEIRPLTSRVFVPASTPLTDKVRAAAAALHVGHGSVLGQTSAPCAWGFPGFKYAPIHITTPRVSRAHPRLPDRIDGRLIIPHTTNYLPAHHVVDLHGLPVMSPTRMLFSLSTVIHPQRLARLVDRAWSRRLTNGPLLHGMLAELEERGRGKITVMREILETRPFDYIPPESNLEARAHEVMDRHGVGPYDRQVNLGDAVSWLARVDFLHRYKLLIVEVDGDLYHLALADKAADEARAAALRAAGYEIVRVSEFEIWHDVEPAMRRIRKAEMRAPLRTQVAA